MPSETSHNLTRKHQKTSSKPQKLPSFQYPFRPNINPTKSYEPDYSVAELEAQDPYCSISHSNNPEPSVYWSTTVITLNTLLQDIEPQFAIDFSLKMPLSQPATSFSLSAKTQNFSTELKQLKTVKWPFLTLPKPSLFSLSASHVHSETPMAPSPANFWRKSQPFMNTSSPLQLDPIPPDNYLILDSEIFPQLELLQSIQHSRDNKLIPDSEVEEASWLKVLAILTWFTLPLPLSPIPFLSWSILSWNHQNRFHEPSQINFSHWKVKSWCSRKLLRLSNAKIEKEMWQTSSNYKNWHNKFNHWNINYQLKCLWLLWMNQTMNWFLLQRKLKRATNYFHTH